jgi:S-DNA-T family DNA segregation ATPase FtsK/SpoIIIE
MGNLGLSTKASVARLAIGRSLGLGALADITVDAKGLEIPATSMFSKDDLPIWIGLFVTHARVHGGLAIDNMESLRLAMRQHWHRGVNLLMEDWKSKDENFDDFLRMLINIRAELPETAVRATENARRAENVDIPQNVSEGLISALAGIGVSAEIRGFTHGPRVTRYKVLLLDVNQLDKLRKGLERLSLLLGLQEAMPTLSHGDEAKTVYLDLPRPKSSWQTSGMDQLREWLLSATQDPAMLTVFPGVDVMGHPFSLDLANAPHLLVGGATGQGKSVCLHALILSLLMKHSPKSLRLALIDPKQVEFSVYDDCGYLYGDDVAVTAASAKAKIMALIQEMESRYTAFAKIGATNIMEAHRSGINLPFIVTFIEELADLVLNDKNVEGLIVRLAQKARAAGIHLVLATQRPDAKTFSGLIRSNIPARIALTVQKTSESNIILDEPGAERLLGAGDMLVKRPGDKQPIRVHGVYVTRPDIEKFLQTSAR